MVSSIDILLLGLVKADDLSAYDLQKIIEDRNIAYWVQISRASIYKKMLSLEKREYVSAKIIKNGSMPEKTIYSITEKGELFFQNGMKELSREALRFFIDYNVVLLNMGNVEKDMQAELIQNIENGIREFSDGIKQNAPKQVQIPVFGEAVINQQKMLSDTMLSWIEDFTDQYKGEHENE